jgi:hypothetical protein
MAPVSWALMPWKTFRAMSVFVGIAGPYPRPRSGTGLVPHPVFKTGCPS